MADFQKAFELIMGHEGGNQHSQEQEEDDKIYLCSSCFRDEGMKINAIGIGIDNSEECPNCKSNDGSKLTKELIQKLCYVFFVRGTIHKSEYGGSPLIQFNEQHFGQSDIDVSPWLAEDVKLLEQAGRIGLFYYGPRFWMIGDIEPLDSLQHEEERGRIIKRILQDYPSRELSNSQYFYRVRVSPKKPYEFLEYDTAPAEFLGRNRFDSTLLPVLYGSPDLELCLHECRTTVEDDLFVAKLVPNQTLKVLDLSAHIDEEGTEFESLDIAVHFLFLAGKHSYDICREIAFAARDYGYDGIIYPSYFSYVRTGHIPFETVHGISIRKFSHLKEYIQSQSVPNVALFGRPIEEKKVIVECINKVIINKIQYSLTFGPAFHREYDGEEVG